MPDVGELFAHYELEARIDRPSESITEAFLARDVRTGAKVTLELVRPGASSVERARFGTRARRLAGVSHPAIVVFHDVSPTHCTFTTPTGTTLRSHAGLAIARARQKLFWLAHVASALATLHKAGIVHGAITLDAMVSGQDGSVKLTVPLGGDIGGSPLDDVRALATVACELVLGTSGAEDAKTEDEATAAERITNAGVPAETANLLGRILMGGTMTSSDFEQKLEPFAAYSGPSTEPLLPVVPRR